MIGYSSGLLLITKQCSLEEKSLPLRKVWCRVRFLLVVCNTNYKHVRNAAYTAVQLKLKTSNVQYQAPSQEFVWEGAYWRRED